jgi:predicted transposase YbfD/YdcC
VSFPQCTFEKTCVARATTYYFKKVNVDVFNELLASFFYKPLSNEQSKWFASDGKELRGSILKGNTRGDAIVQLLHHETRLVTKQLFYNGHKESERPCVLALLKDDCFSKKITLDALHLTPDTVNNIECGHGIYLIGVKDNQKELLNKIISISNLQKPITYQNEESEKGHGRVDKRRYESYVLKKDGLDKRWLNANFQTIIKVERESYNCKNKHQSSEIAYYVSNQKTQAGDTKHELFSAVRNHWSIETNNYIRDVSLKEDSLKSTFSELSRNMATCRTFVINMIYQLKTDNIKEKLDKFTDDIQALFLALGEANFL